jgi:hypothetical protein
LSIASKPKAEDRTRGLVIGRGRLSNELDDDRDDGWFIRNTKENLSNNICNFTNLRSPVVALSMTP